MSNKTVAGRSADVGCDGCSQKLPETTLRLLLTITKNLHDHPENEKYRGPIRKENQKIRAHIVDVAGALGILLKAGFQDRGDHLMCTDVEAGRLKSAMDELSAQLHRTAGAGLVRRASMELIKSSSAGQHEVRRASRMISSIAPGLAADLHKLLPKDGGSDPNLHSSNSTGSASLKSFSSDTSDSDDDQENVVPDVDRDQHPAFAFKPAARHGELSKDARLTSQATVVPEQAPPASKWRRRSSTLCPDLLQKVAQEDPATPTATSAVDASPVLQPLPTSNSKAEPEVASVREAEVSVVQCFRLRVRVHGQNFGVEVCPDKSEQDLRVILEKLTGIPSSHQRIKYGYPPQVLQDSSSPLSSLGFRDRDCLEVEDVHTVLKNRLNSGSMTLHELMDDIPDDFLSSELKRAEGDCILNIIIGMMPGWLGKSDASESREDLAIAAKLVLNFYSNAHLDERLSVCMQCLPTSEAALDLEVDRHCFFDTVLRSITAKPHETMCGAALNVKFLGEDGVDGRGKLHGGLLRDFFTSFGQCLADEEAGLWRPTGRGSLQPTAHEIASEAWRDQRGHTIEEAYRVCGQIFGMALMQREKDCVTLGRPLARSFVRLVQDCPPDGLAELQSELNFECGEDEPDFRGSEQILNLSLEELGMEGMQTMVTQSSDGHTEVEVELIPGGHDVEVTDDNKELWLTLLLKHKLVDSLWPAALAFRAGFCDVTGGDAETNPFLFLLDPEELIELWSGRGLTKSELPLLKEHTEVSPYVQEQAEWVFEVMEEDYSDEFRGKTLRFATGSSRLLMPLEGTALKIMLHHGGDDALPCAMTCGKMLQLPRYSSKDVLRDRLRMAIEHCNNFQKT